ncbi:hypothetical protein BHK98_02760 [Hornefia porci]|uniref:Uncharacterized protein n=1 Tax=Hornefia porci TaxID=2652292 RepID=A0A1Q9JFV1_9FIRM|nr:hypothetical protein [Hornefia porci]OLR55078.1 hypothetical protein BHK98_02760 [Hornefia porci]
MLRRKNIIITLALCVAVLVSTINVVQPSYAKAKKSNTAARVMQSLQSKKINKITIMKNGKRVKITNPYRIKTIQRTLKRSKFVRRKKFDGLKGWIYTVTAQKKNGKSVKITIIDDTLIRIHGKVYKVKKLDLKKVKYCYHHGNITPILQNNSIKSMTVQFHDQTIEITEPEKVERAKKCFQDNKFQRIRNDGAKGWIYRINAKDKDGKSVQEITLISETRLLIDQRLYEGKKVDLDSLDELFGINRYE